MAVVGVTGAGISWCDAMEGVVLSVHLDLKYSTERLLSDKTISVPIYGIFDDPTVPSVQLKRCSVQVTDDSMTKCSVQPA